MTPIKAFLLALLAALTSTMLLGASSSSATLLCKTEMQVCPEALVLAAETKVTGHLAPGTKAVFKSTIGTIECEQSTVVGIALKKEATPLPGEITSLEFSKCLLSKSTSCEVTATPLPFAASIAYVEGKEELPGHGTMTLSNGGKGKPGIKFVCGGISCSYTSEPVFRVSGEPSWASVTNASAVEGKGFLCPTTATYTTAYQFLDPVENSNLAVAQQVAGATKLCKEEPPADGAGGARKCKAGQNYSGGVESTLAAMTTATFFAPVDVIVCDEVSLTGNFQENGTPAAVKGGFQSFIYRTEGGDCTTTLGAGVVQVAMSNLSYDLSNILYFQKGNPQGIVGIEGKNGPAKLRIVFSETVVCEYRRDVMAGFVTNGTGMAKSILAISAIWKLEQLQPIECPVEFRQPTAFNTLKFERPGGAALYIARE